jgi:hypothetical protein
MAKKKTRRNGTDPAAMALGRRGGKATAKARTAKERSEAARRAVLARWRGKNSKTEVERVLPRRKKR